MIAGADLSTKRIGWARTDGATFSISARAGADDPSRRLHELARGVEAAVTHWPPRPALVILEGYLMHSPGVLAIVRLAEIGGVVRMRLFELGVPYVEVTPTQLKRFATGNGRAKKPAMIARCATLGAGTLNDDEADAWLLRRVGRAAYGLEMNLEAHELEVIASIDWPVLHNLTPTS